MSNAPTNTVMLEIEKMILEMYANSYIGKADIKELLRDLKVLVDELPDDKDVYLQ